MTVDLQDLFKEVKDLDQKSVYALLKAVKNNFDSTTFDYLKYKQSVQALVKMDMDEATAHKSAFATASTMGLTKKSLLSSANKYVQVLERERENFATALLGQQDQKVAGRKAEVQELEAKIKSHKQKILELEREISLFQGRIDSVDGDVELASAKIEGTKKKFLSVYDVLNKSINTDITTITKYL